MESPIHALKFAEDLMFHILEKHNAIRPGEEWGKVRTYQDNLARERCPLPIYDAVLGLMETERERIQNSFDQLCKMGVFSVADFRFEVAVSMIAHFSGGYNHMKFLYFCALLGGVSVRYVRAGHPEIPSASAQVLAYLLNFWMYSMMFDADRDYFGLACFSQRVRRKLDPLWEGMKKGEPVPAVFEESEVARWGGETSTGARPAKEGGSKSRAGKKVASGKDKLPENASAKSEGHVAKRMKMNESKASVEAKKPSGKDEKLAEDASAKSKGDVAKGTKEDESKARVEAKKPSGKDEKLAEDGSAKSEGNVAKGTKEDGSKAPVERKKPSGKDEKFTEDASAKSEGNVVKGTKEDGSKAPVERKKPSGKDEKFTEDASPKSEGNVVKLAEEDESKARVEAKKPSGKDEKFTEDASAKSEGEVAKGTKEGEDVPEKSQDVETKGEKKKSRKRR